MKEEEKKRRMSSNKVTSDTWANEYQFVKIGYIYIYIYAAIKIERQ